MSPPRPLAGRRVVTTRDERGRLDSMLAAAGADVVHVPLIEIGEPPDGGVDLERALVGLADAAWLVVTSHHGARRVAAAVAEHPRVRLAAVGSRTAAVLAELAGRVVDLVPRRQTADDLLAAMPPPAAPGERVVVAQADRAEPALADGLTALGYDVVAVDAYTTALRIPTERERAAALAADAVAFASGSAALGWAQAIGPTTPPVAVAIGPTTARVARDAGLQITHVAADHDLDGLVAAIVEAVAAGP